MKIKISKKISIIFTGAIFISCYVITSSFAFDSIVEELKPSFKKNLKGYDIIVDKNKSFEDEYFLRRSKEKVYFVGNSYSLFPFILKVEISENNSVAILRNNHYFLWLFGYSYHFYTTPS